MTMEQFRSQAEHYFNESGFFHPDPSPAYILDGIDRRNGTHKAVRGPELEAEAKNRRDKGVSTLICIGCTPGSKQILQFERDSFMALWDVFEIDHAILRQLSTVETAYCEILTAKGHCFYVRIAHTIFIWTFSDSARCTFGFVIGTPRPKVPEPGAVPVVDYDVDGYVARLMKDFQLLDQPYGLLWLCLLYGIDYAKASNDRSWGPFFTRTLGAVPSRLPDERFSDMPIKWTRDLASCLDNLGRTRRGCKFLQEMHRLLCSGVGSSREAVEDRDALALAARLLDHEIVKADLLVDRIKTQQSSLVSLISRAETKSSMDYIKSGRELTEATLAIAEAAKHDSGAMRTIAYMTMVFLPGTFFAALFSMPILRWEETKIVQGEFWIYLGLSVPTTLGIMLASYVVTRRRLGKRQVGAQRQTIKDDEEVYKEQIVDVMHDLDLRVIRARNRDAMVKKRDLWWMDASESC